MAVGRPAPPPPRGNHDSRDSAFTLLELMVVIGLMAIVVALVVPAFSSMTRGSALTRAVNDVSGLLELARAEAMSTRSYVYIGFANTTNNEGSSELRIGAVTSLDGSSNTAAANLRPISKLTKLANVQMTNYTGLPQNVKIAAVDLPDGTSTLRDDSDYVSSFQATDYLKGKFNDGAFDNCPTIAISPQGEVLPAASPLVFFRTTSSVGLVPTRGTTLVTTDGAIVSYYGGTGQLRVTRPK